LLAPGGAPRRSARRQAGTSTRSLCHRELRRPNGFGDELRAALVGDAAAWGAITLLRTSDHENFAPEDATLVASVSAYLAEGLRRAMLLTAVPAEHESSRGQLLPPVVAAVASRARSVVDGRAAASAVARARVSTASGRWLLVRGSSLGAEADAPTAMIIEAARPHELAPLIADAYGLTERERAITQLVAQGLATQTIGRRLHISPWTVQTTSSRSSRRST
jgi:DNA-binding NarL/FixJ family response regulator